MKRSTVSDMYEIVKIMINDDRYDEVIPTYVDMAIDKVVERAFPFDEDATWEDCPDRYSTIACNIAVYMINKRGAEGETTHRESGTSRTWASADIPNVMFGGITPRVGVPR